MSEVPATYAAATSGLTDTLEQIATDLRANNAHERAAKLNTQSLCSAPDVTSPRP